jgi:basic membrane protein A
MSKKLYSLLALLVTAAFVLAACGPAPEPTAAPEEATEAPAAEATEAPVAAECAHKVGFVTDVGKLRDQGFNEGGWNGVEAAAAELGLGEDCIAYIETADSADYIPNIESFISEGYDIIVTSGFAMGSATHQAAIDHPDVTFIGTDQSQVDANFAPEILPNAAGVIFHEDVSGFLAGALAGLMTESNTVGGVYGCPFIPAVARFEVGYYNGVKYVNPDATILDVYHPGSLDVCFVDPEWAAETANTLIGQGVDVLFAAGGLTGNGGLIAACNGGLKVIGVDVDQFVSLPEVADCIMSSATKALTDTVSELVVAAASGSFAGGEYYGAAALAPFHNFEDVISQDVKDQLTTISAMIDSGEIDPCAPFTLPNGDASNESTFCTPVVQ